MTPYHPQLRHLLIKKNPITAKEFIEYEELQTKYLIYVQVHPEDYKTKKKGKKGSMSGKPTAKMQNNLANNQQNPAAKTGKDPDGRQPDFNQKDHERLIELREKMPKYKKICRKWGKKQKRLINETSIHSRIDKVLDIIAAALVKWLKGKHLDKKLMLKI